MKRAIARISLCIAGCITAAFSAGAQAQAWPVKPIRVIVPFPPGGTSDILMRLVGAKMGENWGQQVIADNKSGANGNIGVELLARSAPDGYTLCLMDVGNLSISPTVYEKLPFDILRDIILSSSPARCGDDPLPEEA